MRLGLDGVYYDLPTNDKFYQAACLPDDVRDQVITKPLGLVSIDWDSWKSFIIYHDEEKNMKLKPAQYLSGNTPYRILYLIDQFRGRTIDGGNNVKLRIIPAHVQNAGYLLMGGEWGEATSIFSSELHLASRQDNNFWEVLESGFVQDEVSTVMSVCFYAGVNALRKRFSTSAIWSGMLCPMVVCHYYHLNGYDGTFAHFPNLRQDFMGITTLQLLGQNGRWLHDFDDGIRVDLSKKYIVHVISDEDIDPMRAIFLSGTRYLCKSAKRHVENCKRSRLVELELYRIIQA